MAPASDPALQPALGPCSLRVRGPQRPHVGGMGQGHPRAARRTHKARELIRVVTPETEPAWVGRGRAMAVTSRVLERDVAEANLGDPAPAGDPVSKRIPARGRVWFEMEAADAEVPHCENTSTL